MLPIPLQTQYGPKTGFTLPERIIGMRPAGVNLTDPARAEASRKRREHEAWLRKQAHDKRNERLYAGPPVDGY